jgi:hypothetical protein
VLGTKLGKKATLKLGPQEEIVEVAGIAYAEM